VLSLYFVSADWPGAGQNELERRHPDAIAMFVAGCGGDQNPLPRGNLSFVEKYGKEFADGVDAALKSSLKPLAPTLKTVYEEIDLPFDKLPTTGDAKAKEDGLIKQVKSLPVGKVEVVTADLAAGNYVIICNVAGHYQLGMRAAFTVN